MNTGGRCTSPIPGRGIQLSLETYCNNCSCLAYCFVLKAPVIVIVIVIRLCLIRDQSSNQLLEVRGVAVFYRVVQKYWYFIEWLDMYAYLLGFYRVVMILQEFERVVVVVASGILTF